MLKIPSLPLSIIPVLLSLSLATPAVVAEPNQAPPETRAAITIEYVSAGGSMETHIVPGEIIDHADGGHSISFQSNPGIRPVAIHRVAIEISGPGNLVARLNTERSWFLREQDQSVAPLPVRARRQVTGNPAETQTLKESVVLTESSTSYLKARLLTSAPIHLWYGSNPEQVTITADEVSLVAAR